jgi:chromatin assembly factor 1 subunit A
MVEQRIQNQEPPLHSIPQEHLPLIAKLGHDRRVFCESDLQSIDITGSFSDKTLTALAKYMQQELIPPQEGDETSLVASAKSHLPLGVVEQAIKSVLCRNNYGLEASNGLRTPAAVCVWRWEVNENYKDWLPKSVREKVESRLQERIQVRKSLLFVPPNATDLS